MQLLLDSHDRSPLIGTDAIAELTMVGRVMATVHGHGGPDTRCSPGHAGDRPRAAEAYIGTSVRFDESPATRLVAAGRSGPLPTVPIGTGSDAVPQRSPVSVSGTTGHRRRVNRLTPRPGGIRVILDTGAPRGIDAPIPAAGRVRDQRSAGSPSVRSDGH